MSKSLLILSVGSNPLPNAIVASYLVANENRTDQDTLPSPDYVLFVYSSGTKKFKDNILKVVPMENNKNLDVGDDIRDYQKIENEVTNQLKRIIKEEGVTNIHVNYTGGTKTMAVAITTAVYKFSSNDNIETIFSDLDPDDFKIRLKNGDCYPDNKDLRNLVNISVDDLYCLHDLKTHKKGEKVCGYHTNDFREALRQECCDWVEAKKKIIRKKITPYSRAGKKIITPKKHVIKKEPKTILIALKNTTNTRTGTISHFVNLAIRIRGKI